MKKILGFCIFIFAATAVSVASAQTDRDHSNRDSSRPATAENPSGRFVFHDGDRVVFLGDTWVEREQKEGYIETMLSTHLAGKKVIFRNLAWGADTVLGRSRASFDPPEKGFERLKEQLQAIKPTVVFLGYGMAESFNGKAGLDTFKKELHTLLETIDGISKEDGVRFIFFTPLYHEKLPAPLPDPSAHNAQLEIYAQAIRDIAAERQARLVDLFQIMREYHQSGTAENLTDNGIHPTPAGFWRLAFFVEKALGISNPVSRFTFDQNGKVESNIGGSKPERMARDGDHFSFDAGDAFLLPSPPPDRVESWTNSDAFVLAVRGLAPGKYTLKVDGVVSAIRESDDWDKGVAINEGALVENTEALRNAIVKKNQLFFYRWRPQNQTYLFGFRRHEQGQNAKEIPMFDPLISDQESRIFQLTALKKRHYELSPTAANDATKLAAQSEEPQRNDHIPSTPLPEPSFELAPNVEATLWAENPNLAKPIQMNFDPQGRLWVASSSVYPQIEPGQVANDKILILEDTDQDGKADKTTVFTDGLLIPTGVMPGDGGAYVANSTELLFYKDRDGDGRADEKRIMLSGFGTEDTHHILHTLRWGFDGQLYMNQSIYIHSHIETPHGVVRLNSGGTLNLRPATQELGIHMKGLINGWGHHFDRFGQSFETDGAGGEGINWVIPQAMFVTYEGARRVLHSVSPGSYPKFCSLEIIESEAFPEDWQGTMITCDFRAHRVVRFAVNEQGAGYITKELPDVMRTTNVTFRPIDVKLGPDGAIYIADWSNPIIQHGEVDFRDPRRDHEHGRIWRLTYKGRDLLKPKNFVEASNGELLDNLLSPNIATREQSRRVLTERGNAIQAELASWTQKQSTEQGQLEALWIYQSIDRVNPSLLKTVLNAKDGRIRAAATRVLSFWQNRIDSPLDLLAERVKDEHPRVRVEAVRAAAKNPGARAAELILSAVDMPMDRFSDYAIWLSINDVADTWVKAIQDGTWKFEGREKQLEYGLKAIEPAQAGAVLAKVLADKPLARDGSGPWLELIAAAGSTEQLDALLGQVTSGYFSSKGQAAALKCLSEAARIRHITPSRDREKIGQLFGGEDTAIRTEAIRLAGQWKAENFIDDLLKIASEPNTPEETRKAAFQSLREMGGGAVTGLAKLASEKDGSISTRVEATKALTALNLEKGIPLATELLPSIENETVALDFWRTLLAKKGAAAALAQSVPRSGLPEAVVKAGLRVAREGGRNEPNLVMALARNIDAEDEAKNLSPQELNRLLTFIREKGDPARGEHIYRRQELGCVSCHSIGGVGGKVGPDLTSIGASAQPDYLVESLQFPNRKVKEGFHSIMVETKDDQELAGILVRETGEQLVLRDASGREVSIPKENISKRSVGGSIMPAGLVDALNEQDQADLYRFLSELGKAGPFDASKGNVARVWKLLPRTLDVAQFTDDKVVAMENTGTIAHNEWQPVMTLVDGRLLKAELDGALKNVQYRDPDAIYAKATFEVAKSGPVHLRIPAMARAAVWIDGKPVTNQAELELNLESGPHTLAVKMDAKALPEFLTASTSDGTFVNN